MAEQHAGIIRADIAIIGAGIAGLWLHNRLRRAGYNSVLLESNAIGGIQTIASQGIIHSGLKYALAGKVNDLAKSISAMPDRWREALKGSGPVDLSAARVAASSQNLLIPSGIMGGLVKLATQKALGSTYEIPRAEWESGLIQSGFGGSVIAMDEPVLDIPSVVRALANPYRDSIGKGSQENVEAKLYIHTAAAGNMGHVKQNNHTAGLETQARPLLMAMMDHAPFDLFAHCVGTAEKPVATITTHKAESGNRIWYFGGAVAERKKEANPNDSINAAKAALDKYLPGIDTANCDWAVLAIDRIEGKSGASGWMPDTPTIHAAGNHLYCWPTKLTFAPLLADMIFERLQSANISPAGSSDFSALPEVEYAVAPWDKAQWIKERSARQA